MTKPTPKLDQRGMVSFMVTLIMMLVISLIVIGFAQVSRRNEREALDRQLSTQAFYAAESGVNDATTAIKTAVATGAVPTAKPSCTSSAAYPADPVLQKDASGNPTVSYSCLLVDPNPATIKLSAKNESSTVVPINPSDASGAPALPKSLSITWEAGSGGTNNVADCTHGSPKATFYPTTNWGCDYAVVQVDLMETPAGASNATALESQTFTAYLEPGTTDENATIGSFATGAPGATRSLVALAGCSGATCTATLQLAPAARGLQYYARITTLYRDAPTVTIAGLLADGSTAHFIGAQAVVDVTGKAQDVLRRLQERIPLSNQVDITLPANALKTSASVCKRFTAAPGVYDTECP